MDPLRIFTKRISAAWSELDVFEWILIVVFTVSLSSTLIAQVKTANAMASIGNFISLLLVFLFATVGIGQSRILVKQKFEKERAKDDKRVEQLKLVLLYTYMAQGKNKMEFLGAVRQMASDRPGTVNREDAIELALWYWEHTYGGHP